MNIVNKVFASLIAVPESGTNCLLTHPMLGIGILSMVLSSHATKNPKVACLMCLQDDNTRRNVGISSLASLGCTGAIKETSQNPVGCICFDIPM